MGPYVYSLLGLEHSAPPIKARDADIYLVKRSSTEKSPNYYWTQDWKTLTPLSEIYPEKAYNWVRSELITIQTIDGRKEQAVLYKPEDFDSTKKYPVIINYYERKSQELNQYHKPGNPSGGDLDISWFVSHGYLVCTPDIHYKTGAIGQGVYNSVLGTTQYLEKLPWVDSAQIGIQGHSFGGFETNYLITHTSRFKAAVSSSGISDFISYYGGYWNIGISYQSFSENSQLRMGATLWQKPNIYIENSPVFQLNKVTTPILIVANKKDGNVPFSQGVELFTGLRRLGKKAWMLQYDKGGHGVHSREYTDYIIRMTQFFNHYLKDIPPPKWMTKGIPAKSKGLEYGEELDMDIKTPGAGFLLEEGMNSTNEN